MKKLLLLMLSIYLSLHCTAQESKAPAQKPAVDNPVVPVLLRDMKSGDVKVCNNCTITGNLAQSLKLKSFILNSQYGFHYNEKQNTLTVTYLITKLEGKIGANSTLVSGPLGRVNPHPGQQPCSRFGFGCLPSPNRTGKTKYEIKTEGKQIFLVVTFLEDLKVEKEFFTNN